VDIRKSDVYMILHRPNQIIIGVKLRGGLSITLMELIYLRQNICGVIEKCIWERYDMLIPNI